MKILMTKKVFIIAFFGLLCFDLHAAASSFSSQAGPSSAVSSPERRHAQFIMLIDDGNETPDGRPIGAATISFFRIVQGEYGQHVPFLVSDSIIYNFFEGNRRGIGVCGYSVDWSPWDIFKVEGTKLTLFVPRDYAQTHPNHGLLLGSNHLKQLPADQENLFAFFNKGIFNRATDWVRRMYKQNILFAHFPIEPLQPDQLRMIFRVRDYSKPDTELDNLPVWDIIILGHGTTAVFSSFRPQKTAKIAGVSAGAMQGLLKFFNNQLRMGTLLVTSCNAGGENINLLQFDQAVGTDTLLNLNFTVIVNAIGDTDIPLQSAEAWRLFFELTAQEKSLDHLVKILSVKSVSTRSLRGTNNIPQVWVPGGQGFQTFQIDAEIKVLSRALVRAREDEGHWISISDTVRAVLLYPEQIDVPLEVEHDTHIQEDISGERIALRMALQAFPTVIDMYNIIDRRLTRDESEFPAIDALNAETAMFGFEQRLYPKFISMVRSSGRVSHFFKRIDLIQMIFSDPEFRSSRGVMQFVRDAFIDLTMHNRSDKVFQIDTLEGPNDLLPLLELIRFQTRESISDLEMAARQFLNETISLHNLFVHLGPSPKPKVRIGFIFGDRAWLLDYNPRNAQPNEIAWKFVERPLDEHMQEYEENRSLMKPVEDKQLSISAALKKRMATEQALAYMKERIRRQAQSMLKGLQVPTSSSSISAPE